MASENNIIFCDNVDSREGEGLSAYNIYTALNPAYIPGLFSFFTIVTLVDFDSENKHTFHIGLKDNTGKEISYIEDLVPCCNIENDIPNQYKGIDISINWRNVNFTVSGEYKIYIIFDGDIIFEKPFYVKGKNEI